MKVVNLGFDKAIAVARIVCVTGAATRAMKRMREEARKEGRLVDVTCGRRTRAVVVTDSGHVILSSLEPQTLIQRIEKAK